MAADLTAEVFAQAAQLSYLAWQQYEAEHPGQVCLAEIDDTQAGNGLNVWRSARGAVIETTRCP